MYLNESEKDKVNTGTISSYERVLKEIEKEEEIIVSSFDRDIEKILGRDALKFLVENNIISLKQENGNIIGDKFLRKFHLTDIPSKYVIKIDGKTITYRDYVKERISKFFKDKTIELKEKFKDKDLDERLIGNNIPKCYALASLALTQFHKRRDMVLRDVQKIAGIGMAYGEIAELGTGEGKTLAAVLPAYLHALRGKGVHVVTANSYLSSRDFEELKPIYEGLGLTCGYVYSHEEVTNSAELKKLKKKAYNSDITYSAKDEIAFDYLRDSRAQRIEDVVTRDIKPGFAIIDEVDDALVDSASSPYVIAGRPEVYTPGMTVADLADTLSVPLDKYLVELERKGINTDIKRVISYEEAMDIAELFSKELYLDNVSNIVRAQVFYNSLKFKNVEIDPRDKDVFERNKHLFTMDHGIIRVNDKRLFQLLSGDTLDRESAYYSGKYGLDINDVNTIRKYTNLIICPTSKDFYVTSKCLEEHMGMQFLSSNLAGKLTLKYKNNIIKYLDSSTDYTYNKSTDEYRLTPKGLLKIYDNPEYRDYFRDLFDYYDDLIHNRNELGAFFTHVFYKTVVANELQKKGEDYIVRDGKVVLLKNAREKESSTYTEGLHQAIEVKEGLNGVVFTKENPSLASITQKDFYSRYELFSGMTGTSAKEIFDERYNKSTLRVPRDSYYKYYSRKLRREGKSSTREPRGVEKKNTVFALNKNDKYELIYQSILRSKSIKPPQPVLIVVSDAKEIEGLDNYLRSRGIKSNVLETSRLGKDKRKEEAEKIARAGRSGMITIATEMAGRGTDIKIGGDRDALIEYAADKIMRENHLSEANRDNAKLVAEERLVELKIIPTKEEEKYERDALADIGLKVISSGFFKSSRIDRQLEGRTGRNGYSGEIERYSSIEDLRHFGLERVKDEPLEILMSRQNKRTDGSLDMSKRDYERINEAIKGLQDKYDEDVSERLAFVQDLTYHTTMVMEHIRNKRRHILELTENDEKLNDNAAYITGIVYKMIEDTVDNLILSYIGIKDFERNIDALNDGERKDVFNINYEGLRLACLETLGIDVDIDFLKNADVSLLEFRNALIKHARGVHDEGMKKDREGQLHNDVNAILLASDNSLARIHDREEEVKRQKGFDQGAYGDTANAMALVASFEEQKKLELESRKRGVRLLLGKVLSSEDKKSLERERKKMFDFKIEGEEITEPVSMENDYSRIESFRKKTSKDIDKSSGQMDRANRKAASRLRKDEGADISPFYGSISVRPMALILGENERFRLRKDLPSKQDLLDSKKTI